MSFDPLLAVLGLAALASPTVPTTYAPTAARAAVRIEAAVLPSTPGVGDLAIDSGASNALKWWDGSAWQTASGGGGTPAGADTQIQYNNAGAFGATSDLVIAAASGLYMKRLLVAAPGLTTLRADTTLAAAGVGAGTATNAYFIMQRTVANGETAGVQLRAVYAESRHLGSNASTAATAVTGVQFSAENGASAGTITGVAGLNGGVVTSAGSTTSFVTGYGVYFTMGGVGGTVKGLDIQGSGAGVMTTLYGVYVDVSGFTNVTNRWGFYQVGASAQNYFAGVTGAGVTPSASTYMSLGGATTAIAPLRIGQSASVPATPTNGDVWLTSANLFLCRNSGTNLLVEGAVTTTVGQIPAWSSSNGVLGDASGLTWTSGGGLVMAQNASSGISPTAFSVIGGAHTNCVAGVEVIDVYLNLARTVQFSTGAKAVQRAVYISAPTYSFVGASTITTAATLAVSGAPVAGTNAAITTPVALDVESGLLRVSASTTSGASFRLTPGAAVSTPNLVDGDMWITGNRLWYRSSGVSFGTIDGSGSNTKFAVWSGSQSQTYYVGLGYHASTGIVLGNVNNGTGTPSCLTVTAAAQTGMTASTEVPDIYFNLTRTNTWATGDITTQRAVRITAPTYAFAGASVITTAVTVAISGAPVAGTNATITTAIALDIESGVFRTAGDVKLNAAGAGVYIKEGSNATMGVATLVGGTITVSTTKVTANSRIFLTSNADGGTNGFVRVSARSAGASFTITSSDGSDTSSIAWMIIEPA